MVESRENSAAGYAGLLAKTTPWTVVVDTFVLLRGQNDGSCDLDERQLEFHPSS
jgi:hypothetical protein